MKTPRFLVLRGGAIGDFVLTLPVLQALRERWPDAYVEVVGYPHIAGLASAGNLADHVESLDRAEMARFFSLSPAFSGQQAAWIASFDLIVSFLNDPNGLVRSNLEAAGARQVIYGSPLVRQGHATAHLVKPLESLAIYAAESVPRLTLRDEIRARGAEWLRERGVTAAPWFLHPGSGSPAKNWPADRYVEVIRRLRAKGHFVVVSLGEADDALRPVFQSLENEIARIENHTLVELAGVMAGARGYVGNDSGITHIAAALSIPVLALFGPSDPSIWGPRGANVTILRAPDGEWSRLRVDQVMERL